MNLMNQPVHYGKWRWLWGLLAVLLVSSRLFALEPLTLDDCLKIAFDNNPDLAQAKKAFRESSLRIEQAQARLFPELNAGAKGGYISELSTMEFASSTIQPGPNLPVVAIPGREVEIGEHEQMNVSLGLQQPLYLGGRIKNSVKSMKAGADIANSQVDMTKNQLRFEVIQAFYQLAKAREMKSISMAGKALAIQHLQDANNLLAQGMLLKSDLLAVELRRLKAELDIVQAENAELRAKAYLSERMGYPPDECFEIKVNWDIEPPWPIPESYQAKAVIRPEQQVAQKNLEIANIGIDLVAGEMRPEIALSVTENYGWPGFINGDPEWTNWWQAGVNLSWNIFDKGLRRKKELEAIQRKSRTEDMALAVDRKIALDRINTRLTYEEKWRMLQISKEKVATAEENYKKVRDNFKEGNATNTAYLDAQTELENARNEHAVMTAELRIAWADYLRALGSETALEASVQSKQGKQCHEKK